MTREESILNYFTSWLYYNKIDIENTSSNEMKIIIQRFIEERNYYEQRAFIYFEEE